MKALARPVLGGLRCRAYSTQPATQQAAEPRTTLPKHEPRLTRLSNGILLVSLETNSPLTRLAFIYNAGTRYETPHYSGIVHALRNAYALSNQKFTQFGLIKRILQLGASFEVTATREHLTYATLCKRDEAVQCLELLTPAATLPAFKRWEVNDTLPPMAKFDLALLGEQPHVQVLEGLHEAAYHSTGLGNSLYMAEHRVGSHSHSMLAEFAQSRLVASNMTIVATGIDHDELQRLVRITVPVVQGTAPKAEPAKYYGGEMRREIGGPLAYAALVCEGVSLGSKDLLAVNVLQKVMGTGPQIKYCTNTATSRVSKAVSTSTPDPYAASCISASYSDSGLFGFQVAAHAHDMDKVLRALVETFSAATKGGITEVDVARAKAQLKASIHMELEAGATLLEDMGVQAMLTGQVLSTDEIEAAIDAITPTDVENIAKKVINSTRPSMSAVGCLANTPYLDQLL